VFLTVPDGHRFVVEFMEVGGIMALIDLLNLAQVLDVRFTLVLVPIILV
jgi:hypothetical protein